MRKTLWAIPVLLLFAASAARADTYDWTITSGGTGTGTFTTATNIFYTNQIVDISGEYSLPELPNQTIESGTFWAESDITIDPATDVPSSGELGFGTGEYVYWSVSTSGIWQDSIIGDQFTMTITPEVATPEPSSVILTLLGMGCVFVMRKRIA
jgi:hypothetical protein